jgi:hypothetical protein
MSRGAARITRPRLDAIPSTSGVLAIFLTKALSRHRLISIRGGRDGGYCYPSR